MGDTELPLDVDAITERMEDTFNCDDCGEDLDAEPVYCRECDEIVCRPCGRRHERNMGCRISQPWNEDGCDD